MIQGSPEWFAIRKGKMSGSHAQCIAAQGKGLETYIYEILAEKYSSAQKEHFTNEHTERGIELEHEARSLFELETGKTVEQVGFVEYNDFSGCSPDGLLDNDGIVEIKCHSDVVHLKFILNSISEIDSKYEWQMQMNMLVTGRSYCLYIAYNPNFERSLLIFRIDANPEKQEKIKAGLVKGEEIMKQMEEKLVK